MGTVVIQCAVTGRDFAVGIETDEYSFATLPDLRLKARCPHCGADHTWSPRQARLQLYVVGSLLARYPAPEPTPDL